MQGTYEQLALQISPEPMCGVLDSRARTSVLQENNEGLQETEVGSLTKLLDLSKAKKKMISPNGYSLKTLETCYQLAEDGTLPEFSLRWMKSGMMRNGRLSTLPMSSLRTEREYILSDVLEDSVDEKYFLSEKATERLLAYKDNVQCSNTITAKYGQGCSRGAYIAESEQPKTKIKQIGQLYGTYKEPNPQAGRVYDSQGISPTLDTCNGGNRMPKIAIPVLTPDREKKRQNGRRFKQDGEPMFTLTAQDKHGGAIYQKPRGNNLGGLKNIAPTITSCDYQENNLLFKDLRIRRLIPKECFRLQTWTDRYYELAACVNSDSQLYKQAGNGVTVAVVEAIGRQLN